MYSFVGFIESVTFPPHLKEQIEKELEREKEEKMRQEMERQMCKVHMLLITFNITTHLLIV